MIELSENALKARRCQDKGEHYPHVRQDIGERKFLNTGKPYVIEQCHQCKCEYVRELT